MTLSLLWTIFIGGGMLVGALLNYRRGYRFLARVLKKK